MALEKLPTNLYVSKQLNERLAKQAAQYEIKTVICNRPDAKSPASPTLKPCAAGCRLPVSKTSSICR